MNYGFIKTAASSLKLKVADVSFNTSIIKEAIDSALEKNVKLLVTPELSVTGYTCADLFFARTLLIESERAVAELADYIKDKDIVLLVGAPVPFFNKLYNCAVVIDKDGVKGIVPKKHLANYNEFYEKRWFASGFDFNEAQSISYAGFDTQIGDIVFDLGGGAILGVELCEDLWEPNPPSSFLALCGANIIANLSASDEYVSKAQYRRELVANQSARCVCAYVYSGASVFESTTDLVFSGATLVCENGTVLSEGERFKRENVLTVADVDVERLLSQRRSNMSFENSNDKTECIKLNLENKNNDLENRFVDSMPFVPSDNEKRAQRCKEIFAIQASGLALKVTLPEKELPIRADGRKMSRVLENLIGNCVKYSLHGTRVFISLAECDGQAVLEVKNTANYEMDFAPDEITERFVRGDAARSTEGSGLGLAIAKSYTEACGGAFEVTVDGDLFKVRISFPIYGL